MLRRSTLAGNQACARLPTDAVVAHRSPAAGTAASDQEQSGRRRFRQGASQRRCGQGVSPASPGERLIAHREGRSQMDRQLHVAADVRREVEVPFRLRVRACSSRQQYPYSTLRFPFQYLPIVRRSSTQVRAGGRALWAELRLPPIDSLRRMTDSGLAAAASAARCGAPRRL